MLLQKVVLNLGFLLVLLLRLWNFRLENTSARCEAVHRLHPLVRLLEPRSKAFVVVSPQALREGAKAVPSVSNTCEVCYSITWQLRLEDISI